METANQPKRIEDKPEISKTRTKGAAFFAEKSLNFKASIGKVEIIK